MKSITYLFDDDYEGPRFTYGLTYRPLDIATVPKGWIIASNREHSSFRFGTIDYPAQLSDRELQSFELTAVDQSGN